MKKIFFLFVFISSSALAQTNLSAFNNLVGKTWESKGKWGNGAPFDQKISLEYTLDSAIIIVKTIGFIDEKQTKLGLRNHGIRKYDKESNQIKFWEFDVFGGLTEGHVIVDENNLLYQYEYGGMTVTDGWEYINENTYGYKVGQYKDGEWVQTFLDTRFIYKP